MGKEEERKIETEKDLEQLKREIAQKRKEIEKLKKTIEEMRKQIQGKETNETAEISKMFEDVSELVDVGFSIFGTPRKVEDVKSKGKGLFGLINDLARLAEESETYQKRINLGKGGVIDLRVSSRPIRRTYTTKTGRLSVGKLKKETSPTMSQIPATSGLMSEEELIADIFEEQDHIRVIAELRGVEEEEINLVVDHNTLTISTDASDRKYYKKVELPYPVEKDSVESSYRNGVLEVKLRKLTSSHR